MVGYIIANPKEVTKSIHCTQQLQFRVNIRIMYHLVRHQGLVKSQGIGMDKLQYAREVITSLLEIIVNSD